ncbi:Alpha--fucosyltransferase C [Daphnia magna]|nr:Alpha--fucosyltransferase C [Daphnia magna]
MFSTEPPDHMPRLDPFEDYFNWTMTYLPESDIPLPYGRIEPLSGAPNTEIERLGIQEHIRLSSVNPAKGKTKLAIWMVSNCHARSNRMQYVRNLQKYVDVDIISNEGKCGGQDLCPKKRKGATCYDIIEKTYKFYLAFENSICRDYVTEKFFDSIGRNLVPIVLGGANYSMIAPKHSYINALDYSPRQLAEYLKEIDQDDSLYAEFFWWKPFYRVVNLYQTNKESFCNLCAALHETPAEKRVAKGLQKWYFEGSHCLVKPKFDST